MAALAAVSPAMVMAPLVASHSKISPASAATRVKPATLPVVSRSAALAGHPAGTQSDLKLTVTEEVSLRLMARREVEKQVHVIAAPKVAPRVRLLSSVVHNVGSQRDSSLPPCQPKTSGKVLRAAPLIVAVRDLFGLREMNFVRDISPVGKIAVDDEGRIDVVGDDVK